MDKNDHFQVTDPFFCIGIHLCEPHGGKNAEHQPMKDVFVDNYCTGPSTNL